MANKRGTKKRKGQISVLIVAILILALAALVAQQVAQQEANRQEQEETGSISAFEQLPFQKYVSQCLEQAAKDGLNELGRRGGTYTPQPFVTHGFRHVALYLNMSGDGSKNIPAKEELESELAGYVTRNTPRCVQASEWYNNITIAGKAEVTLMRTEAIARFKGTNTKTGAPLAAIAHLSTPYLHLFETAQRIVALQKETGTEMPLGALSILADEEGVHFTIIQLGSGQFVIALTPEKEGEEGTEETERGESKEEGIFQFGVQYGW